MTYGSKITFIILLLSLFLVVGCSNFKNFSYSLYDNYSIKGIDNTIKLYKDDDIIKIGDMDYKIKEFKYNSDVVCLKLDDNKYYMIYYFDTSVYGPYTKETLDETTASYSMTFSSDFTNILKADVVYE
jgi:hypothetical protein